MEQTRRDRTVLIEGGNVIDGNGGPVQRGCSVLIKGNLISAIGQAADTEARSLPSTRTIDAKGKTVMPALVDAHCHISYGEMKNNEELYFYTPPEFGALRAAWNCKRVLRAGVTSIAEPGTIHNIGPALRDAITAGMVEGPRIVASGTPLAPLHGTGLSDRVKGFASVVRVDGVDAAVKEVRRQVNDGVDLIKVMGSTETNTGNVSSGGELPTFSLKELQAIVEETHRLERRVVVHARAGDAAANAARAGADWILHCSFMSEQQLDVVAKAGVAIVPTLTALANMAEWGERVGTASAIVNACQLELKAAVRILTRARELGVPLLVGTDSGFATTPYGEWHAREMELYVRYLGYSPADAIVAMTRDNAKHLGMQGLGILEPGRVADILVVDGDPLADIRILQDKAKIVRVIKEGQEFDTSWTELERREMSYERVHPLAMERLTADKVRA